MRSGTGSLFSYLYDADGRVGVEVRRIVDFPNDVSARLAVVPHVVVGGGGGGVAALAAGVAPTERVNCRINSRDLLQEFTAGGLK